MFGPGKYDDATTAARAATKGQAVILIVFDGAHGDGFSAQLRAVDFLRLPAILREVAAQIERDQAITN